MFSTFSTKEISAICNIESATLNVWVRQKYLTPLAYAHRGRGLQHIFSAQQAIGFAICADTLKWEFGRYGTRLGRIGVTKIMRMAEALSDETVRRLCGVHTAGCSEEAAAQARHEEALEPFVLPDLEPQEDRRFLRVLEAIRAKLLCEEAVREWCRAGKPYRARQRQMK
jgi:hypothetical protein